MSTICRPSAAVPTYVSQAHASERLSPPAVRVVKHIRWEGGVACSDSYVLASPTIPIVAAACLMQSRNGFHQPNCLSLCVSKRTSLSVQMHLPYKAIQRLRPQPWHSHGDGVQEHSQGAGVQGQFLSQRPCCA